MNRSTTPNAMILVCSIVFSLLSYTQSRTLQPPLNCSSSCGEITNINYPFRLATDPPGCGDPGYELSCDGSNRTVLRYLSGEYYVKRIWYNNSTIRLVDANLASGRCGFPSASLSPDQVNEIDTRYRGEFVNSVVSFVNCSENVSDPDYIRLPCFSGVYVTSNAYTISNLKPSCSFASMVLVLQQLQQQQTRNRSYEATAELLRSGFDLVWSVFCRDCFDSGGSCDVTSLYEPRIYVCTKDYIRNLVFSILVRLISLLGIFLLGVILAVRVIVVPLILLAFIIHKYATTRKKADDVEDFLRNQQSSMPKRYSYTDITAITNHFRDKLGQGGFGSVYKGQLPGGCFIAVKMLSASSNFTGDDFISEVSTIGRIHHKNVVQLIGFCSEGSHRALVYEYMPNGSLDKHLFYNKRKAHMFSYEKLLEIALGAARGINYLHEGCDVCILHFDIKPHNVLLDRDFVPKIADFGLAKFYPKERDIVSVSTTRGTIGYIAPELISRNFGSVSCKTDVYSFGMVLLEMAGGRRNVDAREANSSRVYFPSWACDRLLMGEDLGLENLSENESRIAQKMCAVGLWCIQMRAGDRPSMSRVVEMLEGSFEDLELPPKPVFSTPKYMSMRDSQSDSSSELLISESVEESLYTNDSNA